jgi:hypothetical protein
MALQPFVAPWPFFSFLIFYRVGRTPWTEDQLSQGRYLHTEQHKHRINAHRHPCVKWDSNPRSQCLSGRSLWSALYSRIKQNSKPVRGYHYLFIVWCITRTYSVKIENLNKATTFICRLLASQPREEGSWDFLSATIMWEYFRGFVSPSRKISRGL